MDYKNVYEHAKAVTDNLERTIVKLKNGKEYIGYFNDNTSNTLLDESKKWNFVVLQFENKGRKIIQLDCNDIISIETKQIYL